jgi:hypothetical protein
MNRRNVGYIFLGGLLIVALGLLYFFNPVKTAIFLPCPFYYVTGHHCPGCGSLRAIHNLLHGNIMAAVSLNPLMVFSTPIIVVMFFNPAWIYKRWVPWVAFGILVCYGIIRNIPAWPFCLLAPS